MNHSRFLLILYFTLQSAYCIRIIYREVSSPGDTWFMNTDWFNLSLPRCSSDTTEEIQTQCSKYGAEKCASNLSCSCTCPKSNATLAFYGDKWQCASYAEMKNRVRCRYRFNREKIFNQTVYLPTGDAGEKANIAITETNDSCNISMSSSKYLSCNATWSSITEIDGTTNSIFYLKHHVGDMYSLEIKHHETDSLRGKLIKLGFNCNPAGGDGEPCVVFKLRGHTDCGQKRSCGVNTSPISSSKPSSTVPFSTCLRATPCRVNTSPIRSSKPQSTVSHSTPRPQNMSTSTDTRQVMFSLVKIGRSLLLTPIQTSLQTAPTAVHLITSSVMPNRNDASLDNRKENSTDTTVIAAAAAGGGAFVIFLICTIIICCRRKRRSGERQDQKRNIFENQEEYEQNTNGHYNMTSLAYEDVDTAIDEKGKQDSKEKESGEYESFVRQTSNKLPVYASVDMEDKIKRRKESKSKNNQKQTLHADAEDKNVAPDLPPCIYHVSESSQGIIPDERPYDEVADTVETNILKLTNCTPSHAEYSKPEIPRFSSKSAKEMVLNKNDTEHYEQVEPKKNFCRDSLMAKVASTGAPQLKNTGYDIPKGIIPDDGCSITLPNKPPIDNNNDIADKSNVNIQDKLRTHAVREPFYDEVEKKPPIIPPSIEGYDVPETVIADESFNNKDDQRIIANAQENSQKLNAPEQHYDEVEQTPQDLPTGSTEIEGYDVPESIISEENSRDYIADQYASGIQNISQNPETQEPFYDQVEENPRVAAPTHPHIEGYDVPESIIAEENNKPTFFKVL